MYKVECIITREDKGMVKGPATDLSPVLTYRG